MRSAYLAAAATLGLCVCGGLATFESPAIAADAPVASAAGSDLTPADRKKLIGQTGYQLDKNGKVDNACGEKVAPKFVSANVGGAVGVAQLVAIPNGKQACNPDGTEFYLEASGGKGFHVIFADQGRIVILDTTGDDGVRDIALVHKGGGVSPVYRYKKSQLGYASGGRNASATSLKGLPALP
jgi:hypothetical protein